MKELLFRSLFIFFLFSSEAVNAATNITSEQSTTVTVGSDSQVINITGSGNLAVASENYDAAAIVNSTNLNTAITVNTTLESEGIIASGTYAQAILADSGGTLASLDVTSGTVSGGTAGESAYFGLGNTVTVLYGGSNNATTTINVGTDAGTYGTITNLGGDSAITSQSGTISSIFGLIDLGSATLDLTINNKTKGTISSQGKVINLYDGNSGSSLTLDNAGTITSSDASGSSILLSGYTASITNSGTITGGIIAGNSNITITNSGTMSGDFTFNDGGVDYGSSLILNNSGTITFDADGLYLEGFSGSITNSGTITGAISANDQIGTDKAFTLTNSGTITGNILLGPNSGSSITLSDGTVTGDVTMGNSSQTTTLSGGTLTGTLNGAGAVSVTADTITNGNIGSTTATTSLSIADSITLDANTNSNSISTGTVSLGSGSTLALNDATISGATDGTASGYGIITSSGTSSFGAIGATNSIASFTAASGSSTTFGGDITATGDITINGDVTFSGTGNTVTANSFTLNSGNNLTLTVSSALETALTVVGTATIGSSTILNLTLPEGVLTHGDTVTIFTADSATLNAISDANLRIDGTDSNNHGNNSYSVSIVGDTLVVTASVVTLDLKTERDKETYAAISSAETATGNLHSMQSFLSGSAGIAEKEEAIKTTEAQVDNSTNRVSFDNIATTSNIVSARLESLRTNNADTSIIDTSFANSFFNKPSLAQSLSAMDSPTNGFAESHPLFITLKGNEYTQSSLWIQTFGTSINQGSTSDSDGYDASSGGVTIGVDRKLSNKLIVGVNTAYSRSRINARNSDKNIDIDTYQIGLYSGYNAKSYFLNTSLGITLSEYESARYISLVNDSAEANFGGMGYVARAEIGKEFTFNNDLLFTPSAIVTAARNNVNSYDETGAGSLNLHVENEGTNYFEARIGGEIKKIIALKDGSQLRPKFSASYGYDFAKNRQKTTANFIGQTTSFTSTGDEVAQGSLKLGTGVSFYTADDITLSTTYELESRTHYVSHSGWFRAGYRF